MGQYMVKLVINNEFMST